MSDADRTVRVLEQNRKNAQAKKLPFGTGKSSELNKVVDDTYVKKSLDTRNLYRTPVENLAAYAMAIADKEKAKENSDDKNDNDKYLVKSRGIFEGMQKRQARKRQSTKHILSLFADIKMGLDIIISSMTSPNKLTDSELNYMLDAEFAAGGETTHGLIVDYIKTYIEKEYKLAENLPDLLMDIMGLDGSAPTLIVNEAVVSDIVNADLISTMALESYKEAIDDMVGRMTDPHHILNPNPKELPEPKNKVDKFVRELTSPKKFKITDNKSILGFKSVHDSLRTNIIKKASRSRRAIAAESAEKIEYMDLFRERSKISGDTPLVSIGDRKEATRKGIGRPMTMRLPSESVIPIFSPGNKDKHLGYIILLDEFGSPVITPVSDSGFNRMNSGIHDTSGLTTTTSLATAYKDIVGGDGDQCTDIRAVYDVYKNVIENKLFESFKSSMYGEHIELGNNEYIYYIMFCRALADQQTTMLYVPAENLVYFSMFNDGFGIGKTLLDNIMVPCGMRAILLFAEMMAITKQSINVTEVDVTLDEMDPDPEKRLEEITSLILSSAGDYLPLGLEDPQALTDWIQRAGYKINVTNMPGYPNIQLEYRTSTADHAIPQSDLKEDLQKQTAQGIGLTPELIDSGFSDDFAIGKIISNGLLVKRIRNYQKLISTELTKYVAALIYNDETLREGIKDIVRKNQQTILNSMTDHDPSKAFYDQNSEGFLDYYIDQISENIIVELPQISDNAVDITAEEYEAFITRVDAVLDVQLSRDLFEENFVGKTNANLETVRASIKAMVVKRWATENNYLPELFDILGNDKDTNDKTLDSIGTHVGSVMSIVQNVLNVVTDLRIKGDKDASVTERKLEAAAGEGGGDGGSIFDGLDSGSSEDGGDEGDESGGEGEGDFTFDLDI